MLPKTRRLSHQAFVSVKQQGHPLRSQHFSLLYRPGTGRVAVVTSSRLSKNAVVRNHLRRQIYNYLRPRSLTWDLIIYPFPGVLKLTYAEICSSLDSLLSKLAPLDP